MIDMEIDKKSQKSLETDFSNFKLRVAFFP